MIYRVRNTRTGLWAKGFYNRPRFIEENEARTWTRLGDAISWVHMYDAEQRHFAQDLAARLEVVEFETIERRVVQQ